MRGGAGGAPPPPPPPRSTIENDADIECAADIPLLGSSRIQARAPRQRLSTSSLGSAAAPSKSPRTYSRHDAMVPRLQHIPDHDDDDAKGAVATSIPNGRACSDIHGPRATSRRRDDGLSSSKTRARGNATTRASASIDRSDAMSARAYSSSSRVLWSGTPSAGGAVGGGTVPESLSDAPSHERIAQWREQHIQALQNEALASRKGYLDARSGIVKHRRHVREDLASGTDVPLRSVLRYLSQEELQDALVYLGLLVAIMVRCIVALGDWSGRGTPPMHGDFEAQRHWLELTWHLPTDEWYLYDLSYWGLDYPPFTAWVSWLCAWVAMWFPALRDGLELDTSRGSETPAVVLYMRLSVLVLDVLIYLPSVAWFISRRYESRSKRVRQIALLSVWLQPMLILVDHGHFQYNSVMLGLSAMSFALLQSKLPNVHASIRGPAVATAALQRLVLDTLSRHVSLRYLAAAVLFSLSLCFKQMALYYAPAIFAIMFGRCVGLLLSHQWLRGMALFAGLACVTTATFVSVFAPWLRSWTDLAQVIHRIFPLARGLFEDKVANVWCALSVLPVGAKWKLQHMFHVSTLAKLSLVTVLLAILPSCVLLFLASIESVYRESIMDDAQAEQVVAKVRRHAGSVASGKSYSRLASSMRDDGGCARSLAASVHDSSRGSDRHSVASGSLLAGSTSTLMRGADGHSRPSASITPTMTAIRPTSHRSSVTPSPAAELFPYTLVSTSLAFFLFGFQTHEKSILLPLLPLTMLMTVKGDRTGAGAVAADWEWAVLTNNVGMFSLWPLLLRDGQGLAWCILLLVWNALIGYRPWEALHTIRATFVAWLSAAAHFGMLGLLLLQGFVACAPRIAWIDGLLLRYPDLFPVLNVLLCMPVFMMVWLWSLKKHLEMTLASGVLAITKTSK